MAPRLDLQEKADAIRLQVEEAWRQKKEQEQKPASRIAVDRFAIAVNLQQRHGFRESKPLALAKLRLLQQRLWWPQDFESWLPKDGATEVEAVWSRRQQVLSEVEPLLGSKLVDPVRRNLQLGK